MPARLNSTLAQTPVGEMLRLNNLGVAWMDRLQFGRAALQFQKLTELEPSFVPGWVNLGIALYYDKSKYDEAEAALRQALSLDPDQIQSHFMLGLIFRNRDRTDLALEAFLRVDRQDGNDPTTNYFLGLLYRSRRDFSKAAEYLRKTIDLQPYNKSAYYNLAQSLIRSGNVEEGRPLLKRFQELGLLTGTDTIGLDYREQGKYAIALDRIPERYLPGRESDPEQERIRVTFTEVAGISGLRFQHSGSESASFAFSDRADLEALASFVGSGVAVADYDQDGLFDVFLGDVSSKRGGALFRNTGNGSFEDVTGKAKVSVASRTMAPLWGDIDNDGFPELYLINQGRNVLYRNNGDGTFVEITDQAGVGDDSWGLSGAFADFDHDGDLDIVVGNFADLRRIPSSGRFPEDLTGADNVLYRNNFDGTFTDVSERSQLTGGGRKTVGIVATDFDNSRDIDFYFVNYGSENQLFSNQRDGSFLDVAAKWGASQSSQHGSGVATGDIVRDSRMDFLIPSLRSRGGVSMISRDENRFESVPLPPAPSEGAHSSQLFDFDNDGDLDALIVASPLFSESGSGSGIQILRNDQERFVDVTTETGLRGVGTGKRLRGAVAADMDNDGDLDIVASTSGSAPLLLRNEGGNRNNWITIKAQGTNSNRSGIGTKVEIRSGDFHLKREVYGGYGLLSQGPPLAHFGLGRRTRIDFLRLLWPGGVLQSELDPTVDRNNVVDELDRKGTSCPILYVWNGETYEFVTDFLGGSAYGSLLRPGVYNYPDTDEYVKLDRTSVAFQDGQIAVSLNNQLEEVIIFDQVELVVVDHPDDFEVVPDEKLLPGPPFEDFKLFSVSSPRPPISARDGRGRSVLERISRIDREYAEPFRKLPFKGYSEPHELVLDLGPVSGDRAILLMHAWIDYADSTSNLAASQAGLELMPPILQVRNRDGKWQTVIERMGFPAGLPKTMTVDLSGKFLSESREVRILTNMRIYWDRILVETGPARGDYEIARLDPSSADLRFYGFPEFSSPDGAEPKMYFYDRVSPLAPWKVHRGSYTRYGDVRSLLVDKDDMSVITRSGDEVKVFFDVSKLPKLSPGWVRDYLLYVDGFGKDMDLNSAGPDNLAPLPFHGMKSFPYAPGESYPDTEEHRRYLDEWNTRQEPPRIRPR